MVVTDAPATKRVVLRDQMDVARVLAKAMDLATAIVANVGIFENIIQI